MLSRKTQAIIHYDLIEVLIQNTKTDEEFLEALTYALEIIKMEINYAKKYSTEQ